MTDAILAHGTLLKRGNGATPEVFTTIAEGLDYSGPSETADMEEVTSHSSGGHKEFLSGLLDGGEFSFDLNYVPANTTHVALLADFENKTARNFEMVCPDPGTITWSFTAFVQGRGLGAPVKGALILSLTLKLTGISSIA